MAQRPLVYSRAIAVVIAWVYRHNLQARLMFENSIIEVGIVKINTLDPYSWKKTLMMPFVSFLINKYYCYVTNIQTFKYSPRNAILYKEKLLKAHNTLENCASIPATTKQTVLLYAIRYSNYIRV